MKMWELYIYAELIYLWQIKNVKGYITCEIPEALKLQILVH